MANTVNGVTAITANSQRERTGVTAQRFLRPHLDETLRGRVVIDTVDTDFVVDDPTVDNTYNPTGQRIFIVGLEYTVASDGTLIIKTKVGSSSAIQLSKFALAAKGGILIPIDGRQVMSPTDQGGKLVFNSSLAVEILVHYVIADKFDP